eukprot:TRINITY_DN33595_c0_g1_i1.p1 TRINITY_DN33595_c0_g1~~TRINITY_DN33595_c0_g1_i1.p1  ORF type:complete len:454 (+),score=108.28 TRINITY_DN33595_c0_g1_i1:63-1424(+)
MAKTSKAKAGGAPSSGKKSTAKPAASNFGAASAAMVAAACGVAAFVAYASAATVGGAAQQASLSADFPIPPDVRPTGCDAKYGKVRDLPRVSIIIPYLNEALDHIVGTMRSMMYYTPDALIEEIIFISDGNKPEAVHADVIKGFSSKVSIIELPERQGLIRAKMVGVQAAKAEVLVFMEPHCILNRQWLEPLLARIREEPGVLAMPRLDYIPANDFTKYYAGGEGHWRFEWNLNLIFTNPDQNRKAGGTEPWLTPATSGGIFAIRRDFWVSLGLYDEGMYQWGGDHVEATFKVWRCGGRIEIIPCSRIGHLFRDPEERPYNVDVNQVVKNYARLGSVWFDGYMPFFHQVKPEAKRMNLGDLSAQISQRGKLDCKSMTWYLENVDIEMNWEKDHLCIPGCRKTPPCCEGGAQAPHGRSTLDRVMPTKLYQKRRKAANANLTKMSKAKDEEKKEL